MSTPIDIVAAFDPIPDGGPTRARGAASGDACGAAPAAARGVARYVLLDVFTDRPLEGNQLAAFTDGRGLTGRDMQRLARELRLSESVFALPARGGGDLAIRIFTPNAELPFAGHPVLGAAVMAGSALGVESVTLETGAGAVSVRLRREEGVVVSGWMSQPVPTWALYEREGELLAALGVGRSGLPVELYDNGPRHVYVEMESAGAVAALRPDLGALAELGETCVSCFAGSGRHWKTRMFAPGLGVAEDPATGSAAGPLAVHLSRHGRIDFGAEIEIGQGAEMERPSLLYAFAEGSEEGIESVQVGGSAVVVGRGELLVGSGEGGDA